MLYVDDKCVWTKKYVKYLNHLFFAYFNITNNLRFYLRQESIFWLLLALINRIFVYFKACEENFLIGSIGTRDRLIK